MKVLTCKRCNQEKSLDLFCKDKRKVLGINTTCKECYNSNKDTTKYKSNMKAKYANDADYKAKKIEARRLFKVNHRNSVLLTQAKIRARKANLDFNIDITDIVIPTHCPILNIPLLLDAKGTKKFSPSLDRIDNSKGYVKGNVRVISYFANHMKADATEEILTAFAANIIPYMKNMI